MCQACGHYKGRLVIDMKAQHEKREARIQAKRDAIKAQRQDAEADQPAEVTDDQTPVEPTDTETTAETKPEEITSDQKS
jgi:hypothetical protein